MEVKLAFKAGRDVGWKQGYEKGFKDGEKARIMEVVDWIHRWHRDVEEMVEWQAKLKEWGLGATNG